MAKEESKEKAADDQKATLIKEAEALGIKIPRTSMASFKGTKPEDIEKERLRIEKDLIKWLETVIRATKANAKLKPIDRRRALLIGRFKAVKSQNRANTYTGQILEAWIEELNLINNNPKSWNKITVNGTKPYTPGNKRKMTAKDRLAAMDLD